MTVVGGGPAGLAAALLAARRGFDTRLVEASPTIGGMAASLTVGGIRVDHGSHRLHPAASPAVRRLLDELLGSDLQVRERRGRIRVGDRWAAFPLRTGDLVRTLPPSLALGAAADQALRPLRRAGTDSYAEVVRVGLGPVALRAFHGPMATKIWGLGPDQLAGELARRRIAVRSPSGLVRRLVAGSRPGGRTFLYPRRGFGQIVDRLAEAAVDAGVRIDTSTRVERLALAGNPGGRPTLSLGRSGAGPEGEVAPAEVVPADRVLWTADPTALGRALGWSDSEPVPRRALVLVYLVAPLAQWSPYDAHYVPDLDVPFVRLSEPRNYRDGDDPPDRTVLCAEIPCSVGDRWWLADDADLADEVLAGLDRLGLPVPPVDQVETRRIPSVYPVLETADPDRRRRVLDEADRVPGVTVLGRSGRVVGDNVHHVLDMAIGAVGCLTPDGGWDDDRWRAETARFERFVVED